MNDDINRRLHEALEEKCWHEFEYDPDFENETYWTCKCGIKTTDNANYSNPDYCADPRLVIEAMRERNEDSTFITYVVTQHPYKYKYAEYAIVDLMMNREGALALLALEWIEGRK